MDAQSRKSNDLLRSQRLERFWTLNDVADKLYQLCEGEEKGRGDINASMISGWEHGKHQPSLFWQKKLCQLYGKSAAELGFIPRTLRQAISAHQEPVVLANTQESIQAGAEANAIALSTSHPSFQRSPTAFDLRDTPSTIAFEQQAGAWLALGAATLGQLFNEGWTAENILSALEIILQGIQPISVSLQSRLFQPGSTIGSSFLLQGEKIALINALGKSIGDAWQLFHTGERNEQALTIAQAQLYILQRCHEILPPNVLPWFYSAVYRLIGAALHFQGCYYEALQSHNKAYITALESADGWNVAQCRSWQAYAWKSLGYYSEALQTIDAALHVISERRDTESIRLQARLLALGAEIAAMMGNKQEVQTKLSASETLLEYLPTLHEEFDRISWLQWAGICVLHFGQYELAIKRLQQALDELPVQWVRRYISTAIPLARALARMKEREETLAVAQKTLPLVIAIRANAVTQEFVDYLQKDLLSNFPSDTFCQAFSDEAFEQLSLTKRGGN